MHMLPLFVVVFYLLLVVSFSCGLSQGRTYVIVTLLSLDSFCFV